jgi:hypothetical protein
LVQAVACLACAFGDNNRVPAVEALGFALIIQPLQPRGNFRRIDRKLEAMP